MAISFTNIPNNIRVPGTYAEISSNSGMGSTNQRALIVGQMLATGSAPANIPVLVSSVEDASAKFGSRSMAVSMVNAYRAVDDFGELWVLPLADATGSTAASATITVTGPATASGSLALYVGGFAVPVAINVGDTAAVIAANIVSAVTRNASVIATAAAAAGVVTVTAAHKGVLGGDVTVVLNRFGSANGEATPAGVGIAISSPVLAGGATDPDPTAGFLNLSDLLFDFIVCPYTSATALTPLKALLDESSGRWSPLSQVYGVAFNAYRGTLAATQTFGLSQNDKHITTMGILNSITPVWIAAAQYAAQAAVSVRADPGVPITAVPLPGVVAPSVDQMLTKGERNTLLFSGISTFTVANDGTVNIERAVTNYQSNAAGTPDTSWLQVETDFCLMASVRQIVDSVSVTFQRKKLVADGAAIRAGSNMVSPKTIANFVVGVYSDLVDRGVCQDLDGFKAGITASLAGNGRVDIYAPIRLVGQLRIVAVSVDFSTPS